MVLCQHIAANPPACPRGCSQVAVAVVLASGACLRDRACLLDATSLLEGTYILDRTSLLDQTPLLDWARPFRNSPSLQATMPAILERSVCSLLSSAVSGAGLEPALEPALVPALEG